MANDDSGHPFSYNVTGVLIAMGSVAFLISILYRLITIWFCQQRTTTNPPQRVATPYFGESTSTSGANLIPTHKYHKRTKSDAVSDDEGGTCTVCLGDFEEGEELRTMPECLHSFHVACIDMWLHSHSSCPICRANAAPSPAVRLHNMIA